MPKSALVDMRRRITITAIDGLDIQFAPVRWRHPNANTRPQTIGYALSDSPVAMASFFYEKFATWTHSGGKPERVLTQDDMLFGSDAGVPTLVVNGNDDIMVPTINSCHLAQAIHDAQLIIYPDSGHGSQYQYPERFLLHASEFLDREVAAFTVA